MLEQTQTEAPANDRELAEETLQERVVIVLVRPQQPGNVGAVGRAMKNMGLRQLVVVAPPAFDVDRARWMAPGSAMLLDEARYVRSVEEAIADCHFVVATTARTRHWRWPAHELEAFAPLPFDKPGRTAILFGPEDSGLSNEDIAYAHALLHIPTDANASLNLSQAVLLTAAAIFGEARKRGYYALEVEGTGPRGGPKRGAAPSGNGPAAPAPMERVEWVAQEWLGALEQAGYLMGHERVLVNATLRQILQRATLDEREVIALRGMFKKMRYKMMRGEGKKGKEEG